MVSENKSERLWGGGLWLALLISERNKVWQRGSLQDAMGDFECPRCWRAAQLHEFRYSKSLCGLSCFILICALFYWSFCSVITRGGELSELVHSKSVQIRKSAKFPKCEKVNVVSHHLCIRLLQSAFTFNKTQAICSSWSTQEDSGVCLLSCIAVSR